MFATLNLIEIVFIIDYAVFLCPLQILDSSNTVNWFYLFSLRFLCITKLAIMYPQYHVLAVA